jgi:hypothetical protein
MMVRHVWPLRHGPFIKLFLNSTYYTKLMIFCEKKMMPTRSVELEKKIK